MKSIDYLKKLSKFEHRGSATKNERKAADYIANELEGMGYEVVKQEFKTTRDNLYILPLQFGILLFIMGAASFFYDKFLNALELIISLISIGFLILELSGKSFETSIMPKHSSKNVITKFEKSDKKKIIVSAHIDTQKGSLMFSPKIVDKLKMIYNIGYLGFALIPVGIVFGLLHLYLVSYIFLGIGLLITFAMIVFLLTCEIGGKYTNGANDNGSGTSLALAIADYYINNKENFPDDVEVIFLFTGSEETGERGMKYFLKRYKKLLNKDTQFIVLDNLGAGKLTYLEGEGMIFYKKAGEMLIDVADEMRKEYPNGVVQKMKNLLLPTDALPVLANGFCGITFISMDDNGRIKNYHWFTDTIDNIDSKLLRYEESFLIEYVLRVSKRISSQIKEEALKVE